MDISKDKFAENSDSSHKSEEESENQIFKFNNLKIGEPKISEENPESDSRIKPKGSDSNKFSSMDSEENYSFKSSTYTKQNRTFDKQSSSEGNWTILCSTEVDSCGRSQADQILTAIQEIHESRKDLFTKSPYYYKKTNGTLAICCYTPDYQDKDFILEVAKAIRQVVDYPYIMYYHKRIGNFNSSYMHTPNGEFYESYNGQWNLEEID